MTVRNDTDVSNIKYQNRQRDSPYPLAVAVAVAAAAAAAVAVAVAVSGMAEEKRISAGSVVSCFEVASWKLWGKLTGPGNLVCATTGRKMFIVMYEQELS